MDNAACSSSSSRAPPLRRPHAMCPSCSVEGPADSREPHPASSSRAGDRLSGGQSRALVRILILENGAEPGPGTLATADYASLSLSVPVPHANWSTVTRNCDVPCTLSTASGREVVTRIGPGPASPPRW